MATTHTITGSIADWIPGADPRRVRAVAYLNIPASEVVVEDSGTVWTASKAVDIDATLGTFAAELLATDATDLNVEPDTLQWTIQLSVVDQQTRLVGQRPQADRRTVTLGPFPVTADGNIGDLTEHFDTPAVSPQWRSAYKAEIETARDEAVAAETAVKSYVIGELGTTDSQAATLISTPGTLTEGALHAAYVPREAEVAGTHDPVVKVTQEGATNSFQYGMYLTDDAVNAGRLLKFDHYGAAGTAPYCVDIQNYPGAKAALVIHQYSGAQASVILDNTDDEPTILIRNTQNDTINPGRHGSGHYLRFDGYPTTATEGTGGGVVTQLGHLDKSLIFRSYSSSKPWTFASTGHAGPALRVSQTQGGTGFVVDQYSSTASVGIQINQNSAGNAIAIAQTAAANAIAVTANTSASGSFHAALLSGYRVGASISTTQDDAYYYTLRLQKNGTGAGSALKIENKGTGPSVQITDGTTTKATVNANGEYENAAAGGGIVLKSPDGTRYRVTVANGGTLAVVAA